MKKSENLDNLIDVIKMAQRLQSEVDGIPRNELGIFHTVQHSDALSVKFRQAHTLACEMHMLLPLYEFLPKLGRELEQQGKIDVEIGDSYIEKAIQYIAMTFGMDDLSLTKLNPEIGDNVTVKLCDAFEELSSTKSYKGSFIFNSDKQIGFVEESSGKLFAINKENIETLKRVDN